MEKIKLSGMSRVAKDDAIDSYVMTGWDTVVKDLKKSFDFDFSKVKKSRYNGKNGWIDWVDHTISDPICGRDCIRFICSIFYDISRDDDGNISGGSISFNGEFEATTASGLSSASVSYKNPEKKISFMITYMLDRDPKKIKGVIKE